jgi:hypothetical protein
MEKGYCALFFPFLSLGVYSFDIRGLDTYHGRSGRQRCRREGNGTRN